jgi:S1-C subfamily serine protease/regulator of sirC expression with transglutaminase-like and TPR domain
MKSLVIVPPSAGVTARFCRRTHAAIIALVVLLTVSPSFSAEKSSASEKPSNSNKTPSPDAANPSTKSVEDLAAEARKSVVVISHYGRDGKPDGVGAGFVLSPDGLIATSLHVIGEARPISVQLLNGKVFDATEVVAWDRKLDLAVIRIDAANLPALPLGDSDTLRQGTPVVAIGNPHGLDYSVVQGVVSAKRDFDFVEMIQVAIPVEPGNSGGPLLDLQGRVHGLLTLKSAVTANLGFAMPVNSLKQILKKPNTVPIQRWLTIGALNPTEWTPLFGARWTQKSGRILVEGAGKGFGGRALCVSQRDVPALPYEIEVSVKLDDEAGAAGLIFATDDESRHFGFYPTGGRLRLSRFNGPNVFSWTVLQELASDNYRPGDWNRIKVRLTDDKITCYVNGEKTIEMANTESLAGKAGLAKFRETRAEFKGFLVGTNLPGPLPKTVELTSLARKLKDLPPNSRPDSKTMEELRSNSAASQALLLERAKDLEREAESLRKLAANVHFETIKRQLAASLEGKEDKTDLILSALLVSKIDNPDVDIDGYRREIDRMAAQIRSKLQEKPTDSDKLEALRDYLFHENGFHGSRTDYYNRANSYINEVLDDREGIPLTLSILFIELGRRLGVDLVGIPLPGHFIVQHNPKTGNPQLIDVFDNARYISKREAELIVSTNTGRRLRDDNLQPATKREIIVRMLRNLLGIASRSPEKSGPVKYLDLIVEIEPEAAMERWSRAMIRLQQGDRPGAKTDFRWLLDHQSPGIDLERVEELYRML